MGLLRDQEQSGATGETLLLNNVQLPDAGEYSVRVSNAAGFIDSANATLIVCGAPTFSALSLSSNGVFRATLTGEPGCRCSIEAATVLGNWSILPPPLLNSTGQIQFSHVISPGANVRFFRARVVP